MRKVIERVGKATNRRTTDVMNQLRRVRVSARPVESFLVTDSLLPAHSSLLQSPVLDACSVCDSWDVAESKDVKEGSRLTRLR
jgi:hypothetical protein